MNTILLCLALTVFQEARGEPVTGQRAVATVVLNRARIRDMSECAVVLEKGQFSWHPERFILATRIRGKVQHRIALARLPVRAKGWQEAINAASYAMAHPDSLQDAEFFHSTRVHPRWKPRYMVVFRIGAHVFYARRTPTGSKFAQYRPLSGSRNG